MKHNSDFIKKHSADVSRYLAVLRQLTTEEAVAGIIWEASGLLKINDKNKTVEANQKILPSRHKPVKIDELCLQKIYTLLKIFSTKL